MGRFLEFGIGFGGNLLFYTIIEGERFSAGANGWDVDCIESSKEYCRPSYPTGAGEPGEPAWRFLGRCLMNDFYDVVLTVKIV